MNRPALPRLTATTRPSPDPGVLLDWTIPESPLAFLRRGDGIVGSGVAVRLRFRGPRRLSDAAQAWAELSSGAEVSDTVRVPGTGLVAFGAFAFADDSAAESVLIVPSVIVGRRGDDCWVTHVRAEGGPAGEVRATPLGAGFSCRLRTGRLDEGGYLDAVRDAVDSVRSGRVEKVVLARDLVGELPAGADLRLAVSRLADAYPETATYAVDGTIGSSPETLARAFGGVVSARVLAGSAPRGEDPRSDQLRAAQLTGSEKDLDEHGYALRSAMAALRPFSPAAAASDEPFALKLPNLWHLASDIQGPLTPGAGVLDVLAALHPTAAVAGTPRGAALDLIARLERSDRGRYAGPVGWVDGAGDGEWAVALRGAQVDGRAVVAHAGAGIVGESVPEHELAETALKFRPILDALA